MRTLFTVPTANGQRASNAQCRRTSHAAFVLIDGNSARSAAAAAITLSKAKTWRNTHRVLPGYEPHPVWC